ncbi:hypothetical protein [Allorhodopirellula solitaria]|uniref:Uncharacterized protein n=1 Tax=Allorhodopirellula solitaria TaxID=2527987 RepID=A0A5C5XVX3_9BACT|nr:hypothetical protein [Allorhodopirellula solitaria]TWT66619.1 hypothetical protein CA85_27160 [Allorhodopirellula solitaria]
MNQSLHTDCRCQRVRAAFTRAIFGGALCFACGASLSAADPLRPPAGAAPMTGSTRVPVPSRAPTRLHLPSIGERASGRVESSPLDSSRLDASPLDSLSASWADLSTRGDRSRAVAQRATEHPGSGQRETPSSLRVGPAPSTFTPQPFDRSRYLASESTRQQLRPTRLPPTGYLAPASAPPRIAAGNHRDDRPVKE